VWKQVEELEETNSKLAEEVQTLKTDIENKETNEDALHERISQLDTEIGSSTFQHYASTHLLV